jgi:hypothetical protein
MEMNVEPNIDVVKRRILVGFVAKLGSRSGGISPKNNMSQS